MKKTLTLLALTTAALMPMMPHAANAETKTYWVTGITLKDQNDYRTAEGWFDAEKERGTRDDNYLCWAAASSNLVAWWQEQQDYQIEAPKDLPTIWDEYRDTFANVGGHAELGLHWWLDGTYGNARLRNPMQDSGGGYYSKSLVTDLGYNPGVRDVDLKVFELDELKNAKEFSRTLVSYISNGYGVELTWGFDGSSDGHSVTLWGVDYDDSKQVITNLYLSDSDHDPTTLKQVPVLLSYFEGYETLAARNEFNVVYYKAWSFTVLNSRLSNDYHYFNILDEESGNIIMKQSVEGSMGYTLTEGTQEVNDIIFDGSRGMQSRLLTVEGEHTAERLRMEGSGTNTIDVTKGGQLVVEQITGGQNLTKTGEGALEIKGGTHTGSMDIQAGDVHNLGQLGDVTLANGGSLVNEGTTGNLTVGKGSEAEIVRAAANSQDGAQAFTLCTVEEGGVLTGSGNFGQVVLKEGSTLKVGNGPGVQVFQNTLDVYSANLVFSIDDAMSWRDSATADHNGWGSYTYSTVAMSNKPLNMYDPEFTFVLGENILKRIAGQDLQTMVGQTFSTSSTQKLDMILFSNIQNYGDYPILLDGYTTNFVLSEDLLAQGYTADIIMRDMQYYMDGKDMCLKTGLNVTLAKAPAVPEPTTSTLSLLALASLCARRRRK